MESTHHRRSGKHWERSTQSGGVAVDKKGIDADQLLQGIGDYDGMIVRGRTKVTKEVFDAAKKLKVVGRAGSVLITSILKLPKSMGLRCELPCCHLRSCS